MKKNITDSSYITLEYKGRKFKTAPILFSTLSIMKQRSEKKWDNMILITGNVGTGKSTLGTEIIGIWEMLFGREVSIDNFTWRAEGITEFTDKTDNETHPILFDEAIQGGTGRDSITKAGNALKVTLVTKRRKRHLYVLLVDELQEYSKKIISRATCLIDCRTVMKQGEEERGYFKIYNKDELTDIYWLLKKYLIKNISEYKGRTKPFYRSWDNTSVFIDEEEYQQKKIQETTLGEEKKITLSDKERNILGYLLYTDLTQQDIANRTECSASLVGKIKKKFKMEHVAEIIKKAK